MNRPTCDLCGGGDFKPLLEKGCAAYVRCRACSFIRADLTEEQFLAANETFFTGALDEFAAKSYARKKQRVYAQRLLRLEPFRGEGRLLEIGANVGGFLFVARDLGWEGVGIEPVAACAAWARETHGLDVREGTLEEVSLEGELFDVIYANAVFEHLVSPRAVLEAAVERLRPGGVVLIDTVNWDSYTRDFIGAEWKLIDPWMHYCLYTPNTLRKLCEDRGLQVIGLRSHRVRLRPEGSPRLRGLARWWEELRKLPWSLASRSTLRGESLEIVARYSAVNAEPTAHSQPSTPR